MTKRVVTCPICEIELGKFHNNASSKPVRNHILENHPFEWDEILLTVDQINKLQNNLKVKYGIGHWDLVYYHKGAIKEIEFDNRPPLTEDQIKKLQKKILKLK